MQSLCASPLACVSKSQITVNLGFGPRHRRAFGLLGPNAQQIARIAGPAGLGLSPAVHMGACDGGSRDAAARLAKPPSAAIIADDMIVYWSKLNKDLLMATRPPHFKNTSGTC